MKKLWLAGLIFAAAGCFGNVGVFRGSGQTPVLEKSSEIQMVEELVEMRPRRGDYPVDTSCRNLDKMDFRCRFLLRNLSDKKVVVQVGFPLDTDSNFQDRDGKTVDTKRIIRKYDFSVRARGRDFPVRFVPWDKDRKFSKLFLWEMTFAPKEELELFVTYTMEGYFGMAGCSRTHWKDMEKIPFYRCRYLEYLIFGVGEIQSYVTETGSSWAGEIEKAVFRYYPYEFEEYLAKRGAWEETAAGRREREKYLEKQPLRPGDFLRCFVPSMPMTRIYSPELEEWRPGAGKKKRDRYVELVRQPFRPKKDDDIRIGYVFPVIPMDRKQFELFCDILKLTLEKEAEMREHARKERPERYENYWKKLNIAVYGPDVRKNVADAVLEFHGIPRNNPEIADFLADQYWYPVKNPPPLDESYRQFLLDVSRGASAPLK